MLTTLVNASGGIDITDLVVESNYFLLYSEARVGDQISDAASLLKQDNAEVKVLRRTDAHF